ncbi:SDR family NAD(P)-dependent oxidoreductase [Microbacterium sp. NPDC058389]|uniref:SDR family NAD(P)-dependent oxidoreductase n=1 Tax=Microbacterium sp. NPDC058389 TaxID=3346475 RepID=UPI00365F908A
MGQLDGRVAIITGASRGIGRSIAELFREEGADVIATDIDPEANADPGLHLRYQDVASEQGWTDLVAEVVAENGRLDILVNNASISSMSSILDQKLEAWNRVLAVDLGGIMLGMRACAPQMVKQGGGSIINFSSIYGNVAVPFAADYHAAKGGIRSLTKHAAMVLATDGVRVNSIHPGFILTPTTQAFEAAVIQKTIDATPMGRAGDPREIAEGALFLASDRSSFMTGSELVIDGGFTAQ